MRKLRIAVMMIILAFSFSVKAEVMFELDCDGKEITKDKSVTCEGWLSYETEGINDIEISYDTNLDIKFLAVSGFNLTKSSNKVSIHSDTTLYDILMNSEMIMKFTLSINENIKEKETVKFYNLKINKTDSVVADGYSDTFTVSIPKVEPTPTIVATPEIKKSSVCTLDNISVDNVKIADFDKEKLEYRGIRVNKRVVYIDATRTHEMSSAQGLGDVLVLEGETIERDITVIAEDGTKKVYKLFITNTNPKATPTPTPTINPTITSTATPEEKIEVPDKEESKNSDNTLKTLELYNGKTKIDFKFDKKKDEYDIKIDDTITKITIKATLNDNKAFFVKDYGPRDVKIDYGENKILIKIKAENGDEKTIILNINYINSDNTLKSLKINNQEVDLTADQYEIKLINDVDKTKIEAIANNEKAIIKYEDVDLVVGDNDIVITVTSNNRSKEYHINVIREEKAEEETETIKEEITDVQDTIPDKEDNDGNSNIIFYLVIGIVIVLIIIECFFLRKSKKEKKVDEIEEI